LVRWSSGFYFPPTGAAVSSALAAICATHDRAAGIGNAVSAERRIGGVVLRVCGRQHRDGSTEQRFE